MDELFVGIVTTLIVVLAVLGTNWHFSHSRTMVEDWAREEDVELLDARYCFLWRGPFWWRSGEGHAVYRISVRYPDGIARTGYARCGSFLGGMLFSDDVFVEWDD